MTLSVFEASEHDVFLEPRDPFARPGPVPVLRIDHLLPARDASAMVKRASTITTSSSSTAAKTCGPNDTTGFCERPVSESNSTTIPIVLGVVLPLGVAFIILLVLHRRHVKKLRQEDADDKYKSLDFGVVEVAHNDRKKNRKSKHGENVPEMTLDETKATLRREKGMSMDLSLANPYLLPPGLQQSRESLHSLSRSLNNGDDKYRPATTFFPNDGSISYPSSLKSPHDDSSSFTGSSRRRFESDRNLLKNAQHISRSGPPTRPLSASGKPGSSDQETGQQGLRQQLAPVTNYNNLAPFAMDPARSSFLSTTSSVGASAALRASNNYLGAYIRGGNNQGAVGNEKGQQQSFTLANEKLEDTNESTRAPQPPPHVFLKDEQGERRSIVEQPKPHHDIGHHGGKRAEMLPEQRVVDASPLRESRLPELSFSEAQDFQHEFRLPEADVNDIQMHERHSREIQPLDQRPPQQEAALRKTSHDQSQSNLDVADEYDEIEAYEDELGYDPRQLTMGMRPLPPDDPSENPEQRANRIRSFYKEYFDESKSPKAQQSPRSPQNVDYFDGSENFTDDYGEEQYYDPMAYLPPRRDSRYAGSERHRATISDGSFMSSHRPHSTASGQWGGAGRQLRPKKKLPPPKPLQMLPTPSMLKDDNILPIDFAPPTSYKERRAGTPESLYGGVRPYSPGKPVHNLLASSFDDLSAMPSPHALRKSATYTALDFAPPPRFRSGDSASDSGSIRSNRSAMSVAQLHNIRSGAYRISRIPKEVAGTKVEMADALRPQWDMRK